MPKQAVFAGLVVDEFGNPVETTVVGDEPMYVVNDHGFRRHIPSEVVDRQVLHRMTDQIKGHEDILGEQTAKMLGQEDIFSRAMILNQLKNIDQQIDQVFYTGIPEEGRAYLGMMGFKVIINVHGEVINLEQPGGIADDDEGGDE
jgi:hypothetical protein